MNPLNLLKGMVAIAVLLLPLYSNGQERLIPSGIIRRMMPPYVYGQGITNVPLGVMPMQFNSSFAGEADGPRLSTAFTYDFGSGPDFMKSLAFSYHTSYDQFIPALRSGIGISVHRGTVVDEIQWSTADPSDIRKVAFNSNRVSLAVAPKFSIDGKYTISPSVGLSYGRGNTEANFPSLMGPLGHARDYPPGQHQWLDSRLGLLFNTSKYYIGYSAYIVNRHYFNNENSGLLSGKFISYLQAGYTFQKNADSKFSFTSQVAYRIGASKGLSVSQYIFDTGLNLTFRYDKYLAGLNNTGIHLGWQNRKLRIISTTNPFAYGGSRFFAVGNLSFRYIFKD